MRSERVPALICRVMRMSEGLRLALYHGFARHLPPSATPAGQVWRRVRARSSASLLRDAGQDVNVEHGASFGFRKVSLGDRSGLGVDCRIYGPVTIGQDVMMGRDVVIVALNHGFADMGRPMIEQGHQVPDPVTIEDDVWIGDRVLIVPGVTVGRGAILGLGAVVTKDVPPYAIMGGNPARVLKFRTDQT